MGRSGSPQQQSGYTKRGFANGRQHATIRVYGEKLIPLNHESRSEKHYYPNCCCNWILVSLAVKNNCRIRTYLSSTCFNWKANYAAAKKPSFKGKKLPNSLRAAVTC